jgi:hypothetical protein
VEINMRVLAVKMMIRGMSNVTTVHAHTVIPLFFNCCIVMYKDNNAVPL